MNTRLSFSYFSSCHLCLLVVLASFHLCLSNKNLDDVLCLDGERQALLIFKAGLFDFPTGLLKSWVAENRDCCKWAGIVCDNSTRHVHQIRLPRFDGPCDHQDYDNAETCFDSKGRLRGDISPSLLELKQLEHLDLSYQDFGGTIPKFIGSLKNLRYLNLSSSHFNGVIPPQLGNLTKLEVLCLGSFHTFYPESTSLINMGWLSSLGMLHHLDLSGVDLSKATDWLQVINTLPSLAQLHLSGCELSNVHSYVPSLNLTSLSLLDLSLNNFDGSPMPQWIFAITSLVSLDFNFCYFYRIVPGSIHSFRNLTSLEFLHMAGNDILNSSPVFKDLSGSNIISLDIRSCGVLSSSLDSLHNLTSLISLDLSGNRLTTRIPKSLGDFCNLREIDLSYNKLGHISLSYLLESFFECKSPALESLSVRSNNMTGIITHSIGHLHSLRTLNLFENSLSGRIPYSLGQLSSLEELILTSNQLNNSLPDSLGQLSKLVRLDISHNLLTGVVTEVHFTKLVSLKIINGEGNDLTLRVQVANWTPPFQLQILNLNSWVIGPQFPLWLQSQKDILYLDISNTNISSLMPESFVRLLPNLVYLYISGNRIRGTLTLSGISAKLKVVDLSFNEFSGSLHHVLCSNDEISIQDLDLGNNRFSGVIPNCLETWQGLVSLNLENNNLSGEIPRTLGSIRYLRSVNMRGNMLSGRIPSSLTNLAYLESLQLEINELVGSIPAWIGTKLTSLRLINFRSNNFRGNIPDELCHLTELQILDLSHNNLSGNIPRCFNNFTVLSGLEASPGFQHSFQIGAFYVDNSLVIQGREDTYNTILGLVMLLDLSSNNLVGHIPSELTSLRELISLNLSRNQLIGTIPENIGDMKALISFDLSFNKLSGKLPMSLSRLNQLSSFNVSYNNLIGRIPTSTQIQSLNESSFFGNKLCGAPLTEADGSCVIVEVPTHATQEQKEDDGEDWGLVISVVVGFVTGFWMIIGPLIVRRSWRIAYFGLLNKLRYMVYDVMHKYCCHMFSC